MKHYFLNEIVDEISQRENDPSNSSLDKFVGLEHYVSGDLIIKNYGSTSNLNSAMKIFKSGDILVARRNVYLKRASMVNFDGLTSGDSIVLRAKNESMGKILPFILNTDDFWEYADKHSDGTMSKRLSPKVLKEYEFDLPDDDKLDSFSNLLWSIYNTKESYEELLNRTDELVKARFVEMFGDVSEFKSISEITDFFGDGDWIESKDQSECGIRLIQTGNVGEGIYLDKMDKHHYISEETFKRLGCQELHKGDILISRLPDPVGRACILPDIGRAITAVDCAIVRLNKDILNEYFIGYTNSLQYKTQIARHLTGSTRKRISRANLGLIKIPVPEINEQIKYIDFVKQANESKALLCDSIKATNQLLKTILNNTLKEGD